MPELQVGLEERSYPIIIRSGCLHQVGQDLFLRKIGNRYGIIADDRVAALYGDALMASLKEAGIRAEILPFPHGEAQKTLRTVESLARALVRAGFDRKDALIALGGGVTGDVAGFLASAFMRGIPFVQIPTTLLAQVDSSVGGKTGVDIPEGKNLIGAFYQPKVVYIDTSVLRSLPREELLGGLAEVIKYGVIRDAVFFNFLAQHRTAILDLDEEMIGRMVMTCCRIKAEIVAEDEREGGIRRILNYGHTIGHAVEGASNYTLIHGFAVAIGMAAATRLAVLTGHLAETDAARILEILNTYELPVEIPGNLDRQAMKKYLLADKKVIGGRVHYVLPTAIGSTCITADIGEELVDKVLDGK